MKAIRIVTRWAAPVALAMVGLSLMAIGCRSSGEASDRTAGEEKQWYLFQPPPKKAGAELWAENCTRCHNARPPEYYSDAQAAARRSERVRTAENRRVPQGQQLMSRHGCGGAACRAGGCRPCRGAPGRRRPGVHGIRAGPVSARRGERARSN